MKLYLSGGGSGKQNLYAYNSYFNSIDKNKPILYIPLALDSKIYDDCYNWFKNEIGYFNFTNFEMVKSSLELSKLDLNKYNSLFIGGGNTYKLLKELKDNSNFEKINQFLLNDGIIYGGSAGAIIFGKDIDGCLQTDERIDVDTRGFNFLNSYSLLCHFNKASFKANKNYLKEYSKKNKLLFLPEEDVIVVTNKKISFIGNEKYCLFFNGNNFIHSSSNFKEDIKMKNKYVITLDLDGTLLNSNKKVTSKTKKYLKELHDNGHILVVASGRIFDTCYEIVSKLNFIDYMITDSGSIIYDIKKKEIIYKNKLSRENIESLINLYNESFEYIEFSDEHYYYKYSNKDLNHYGLSRDIRNIKEFIRCNNAIHSSIKLVDYNDNYKIISDIKNKYKNLYVYEMKSENGEVKWLEIVRKGVSKFQALKYILKKEKVSVRNTISFGDNYNDLEILEKSKYGVAMGNAVDEVKRRVLYYTKSCDDDGIEFFLREFFNKNERI